jgi:hypothetical protein
MYGLSGSHGDLFPPWFLLPWTCPAAPGGGLPPEAVSPMILGFLGMIVFYLAIFGLLFVGLAVWGAHIGYGLYGALATLQGGDFFYVFLGSRAERYLEDTSAPSKATP